MSLPRKAVIPAAGRGTRFLPLAKSVPKEMLPLGAKPAIHWIAAEAAAAGVTEVIIVTADHKTCLEDYFTPDPGLDMFLADQGKQGLMHELEALLAAVQITFVTQPRQAGLGDAILCAAEAVGDEPMLVLLGDAPILAEDPVGRQLAHCSAAHGDAPVIGLRTVAPELTRRYGIVSGTPESDTVIRIADLVEKPEPEAAPSLLAVNGRYLLPARTFALLESTAPAANGEVQLTDALVTLAREQPVYGLSFTGRRYDIGSPAGYLEAAQAYLTVT